MAKTGHELPLFGERGQPEVFDGFVGQACENCFYEGPRPMCFKGERWCSELCRKDLVAEDAEAAEEEEG